MQVGQWETSARRDRIGLDPEHGVEPRDEQRREEPVEHLTTDDGPVPRALNIPRHRQSPSCSPALRSSWPRHEKNVSKLPAHGSRRTIASR